MSQGNAIKIRKIINDLKRVRSSHLANAKNDKANPYHRGCYNGIEFALAILENREASFIGVKTEIETEYISNWVVK